MKNRELLLSRKIQLGIKMFPRCGDMFGADFREKMC